MIRMLMITGFGLVLSLTSQAAITLEHAGCYPPGSFPGDSSDRLDDDADRTCRGHGLSGAERAGEPFYEEKFVKGKICSRTRIEYRCREAQ